MIKTAVVMIETKDSRGAISKTLKTIVPGSHERLLADLARCLLRCLQIAGLGDIASLTLVTKRGQKIQITADYMITSRSR